METSRRTFLASTVGGAIGVAGCLGDDDSSSGNDRFGAEEPPDLDWETGDPAWMGATIEDVRTGETFTVAEIDQPVLLHTFATWCSVCQRQHTAFSTFLDTDAGQRAVPVELNVDPNEDPETIAAHATDNDWNWTFAVSPSEATGALVEQFGSRMTSPPSSPVLLVCPNDDVAVLDDSSVIASSSLETFVERC